MSAAPILYDELEDALTALVEAESEEYEEWLQRCAQAVPRRLRREFLDTFGPGLRDYACVQEAEALVESVLRGRIPPAELGCRDRLDALRAAYETLAEARDDVLHIWEVDRGLAEPRWW